MRRNPTIHDVAGALGMHKSTVSLALSGKGNVSAATRARVIAEARKLGYEPNPLAQRLSQGHRTGPVCLFCGALDLGLATQKIILIQQELNARALEVPLYSCAQTDLSAEEEAGSQAAQMRHLCRQRPRAILFSAYMVGEEVFSELAAYQREGGIVVSYDTPIPLECDQVVFDREDNAYRAARHLLEQGHTKVGIGMSRMSGRGVGSSSDPQPYRLRGFRRALEEFGVPVREDWLFRCRTYEPGGIDIARAFLAMPERERPTAMCVVNDYVALGFMTEVMRAGVRVPDDLSIIGHDNQSVTEVCPVPLTAMTHPAEGIAGALVGMLMDRLDGTLPPAAPPRTVRLTGDLVLRASTAPAPVSAD